MTKEIKAFIEENIETIENNRWFLLFMNWYILATNIITLPQQWDELIDILKCVDNDILETTQKSRESVIITITRGTIDDIKNNRDQWGGDRIPMRYLLSDLYTTLGLSKNDLKNCIHHAAQQEGLSFDIDSDEFILR